jgi:hypothetical protein
MCDEAPTTISEHEDRLLQRFIAIADGGTGHPPDWQVTKTDSRRDVESGEMPGAR